MASQPLSPIRKAWYRWKALRLPWRKRFLVGLDLTGNTYWEFADKLSSDPTRMRRIVQSANSIHYSDVSSQITPAWHQWLRHTRQMPPSLTEQSHDVLRQAQLKVLAARADARWAAKPSVLDMPGRERGLGVSAFQGMSHRKDQATTVGARQAEPEIMMPGPDGKRHHFSKGEQPRETKEEKDPWKRARGGPSEEWQPRAWDPNTVSTKK